jgi:hypothetical protein
MRLDATWWENLQNLVGSLDERTGPGWSAMFDIDAQHTYVRLSRWPVSAQAWHTHHQRYSSCKPSASVCDSESGTELQFVKLGPCPLSSRAAFSANLALLMHPALAYMRFD